jgi:hypothetical protein
VKAPLATLATGLILAAPGAAQAQAAPQWSGTSSGVGIGLILGPRGGDPVFSLACVRGTREVLAIAYRVRPRPGSEEASLVIGTHRFAFIVKPQAMKEGRMLQASAKAGRELLAAIRSGEPISLNYGTAEIGTYPAPPAALAVPFAQRCGPLV